MTESDPVIVAVAAANPVDPSGPPSPQDRAGAEAVRRRVVEAPAPSRRRPRLIVPAVSAAVVVAVMALFLGVRGHPGTETPGTHHVPQTVVLQALPTARTPTVTLAAVARVAEIVRERLSSVPGGARVAVAGTGRIRVTFGRDVSAAARAHAITLLTQPTQLGFYDWEADVLTPGGQTVASRLRAQDRAALQISQGGAAGPGSAGAGSMSLYAAVRLASRQPPVGVSPSLSRLGDQYYLFGLPRSGACPKTAADGRTGSAPDRACLLAGPVDEAPGTPRSQATADLDAALLPGVAAAQARQGTVLAVPQGTVIVQAAGSGVPPAFSSPAAQFYVLKDALAVSGDEITHPTAGTDQGGAPDVRFGFTTRGAERFRSVTAEVAHRGATLSHAGETLEQHFAVALVGSESRLLTVPSIDFQQYPDGIVQSAGDAGADITGGLTVASARALATQLRLGALPLELRVVGS
jgi:SecD/SecF fusion protein